MTEFAIGFKRVIWIVLDSVGIGELPDAAEYGDVGRTTLGHIAESRPLKLPNLVELGLANIAPLKDLAPAATPLGAYGKGGTHSPGKDTTTGHWEMAGVGLGVCLGCIFRAGGGTFCDGRAARIRRWISPSRCCWMSSPKKMFRYSASARFTISTTPAVSGIMSPPSPMPMAWKNSPPPST